MDKSTIKSFVLTTIAIFTISQNANASLVNYKRLYMPVYTSGSDASPELTVREGTFVTPDWLVLEAAILPYYTHTIGYQFVSGKDISKDGENINPASTMNLKIEASDLDYGNAKTCSATLDITNVKLPDDKILLEEIQNTDAPENEKITVAKILEQVVIAMDKNLAISGYKNSCNFSVKGWDRHPEIKKDIQPNSPLLKTKLNIKEK